MKKRSTVDNDDGGENDSVTYLTRKKWNWTSDILFSTPVVLMCGA